MALFRKKRTLLAVVVMLLPFSSTVFAQNDVSLRGAAATSQNVQLQQKHDQLNLDEYPVARDFLEKGQTALALSALQADQVAHDNDPNYFNLVGILAQKIGDYPTAASAFERVVLMQPDNAGAWLDLAIASVDADNLNAAAGYFDYIEAQFAPPPSLRSIIARYRTRIVERSKIISPWAIHLEAVAGIDSNANSGLRNGVLPLTLGTNRVDFILDPTYRARSDNYTQLGFSARYAKQFQRSRIDFLMGMRQHSYFSEHDFSILSANLGAGLQRPATLGEASVWLHFEHLALGGTPLLHNARIVAQIERPFASCRFGSSAEAEWRRYISQTSLNADVYWLQAGLACDWRLAKTSVRGTVVGRMGVDTPIESRAGGRTKRYELISQLSAPLGWGVNVELGLTLASAHDAHGYSPLLENGASRRLNRRSIRFLATTAISESRELFLILEDNRFTSNLALFQQNGENLAIGFRKRF